MSTLKQKLQIRDDMGGKVSGLPAGVDLEDLPQTEQGNDFVIVFVQSAEDLAQVASKAVGSVHDDGVIWFCYPKKSSGINTGLTRDNSWQPLRDLGYRPVRQIAIDETWSALRFREAKRVGK